MRKKQKRDEFSRFEKQGLCTLAADKTVIPSDLDICDMIKGNESDVGIFVFEILAKTVFKFLCFILFSALTNPL